MNIIIEQAKNRFLDLLTFKSHLRLEHDHEDEYLKAIIDMATEILENSIGKPILKKKYKYIHYSSEFISSKKIQLPAAYVQNVVSVKKIINENLKEKCPYTTEICGNKTCVITNGSRYPIEIKYIAGMTDNSAEISKDLQFAVLQIAKNIYECSEEDILESKYVKHIIDLHRPMSIN
ncbi:MAG: head-tail connector protein [Holosporales bacterium]|jgi:hypothetical protein|nr:head-tail connector protein [Holosporales bacterium]